MLNPPIKTIKKFTSKSFKDVFFYFFMSYVDKKMEAHLYGFIGLKNIPKQGPVIVIPNHQSYFDGFVITSLFWKLVNRKVKIPTNIKALRNPVVRECQIAGGAVPIDPNDTTGTYEVISNLLDNDEAVVMYPEGTRSDSTFLHPFKYGAFNLAVEHNIPILPVAIKDFSKVLPKGSLQFKKGTQGQIVFGELIHPSDSKFNQLTNKPHINSKPKFMSGSASTLLNKITKWLSIKKLCIFRRQLI